LGKVKKVEWSKADDVKADRNWEGGLRPTEIGRGIKTDIKKSGELFSSGRVFLVRAPGRVREGDGVPPAGLG